ncbi:Rz1 family lipoprotein [Escherichia coli]|uniref:Rz1 family lipoprotein n=1 Tax=Escherichia coli TaxID=562 RepID=UPI00278BFAEF|nr:Rz1 family lipoprotein [Escherichia coli]
MLMRLSKVSVLMFLLGVSACKSPPPVQSQRPEPAAWAMEKAQDLQQMLNEPPRKSWRLNSLRKR